VTQPADDSPNPLSAALAVVIALVAVVAAVAFLGLRDDDDDAAPGTVAATATPSASAGPATAAPTTGAPVASTKVGPCTYRSEAAPARDVTPPTEADLRTGSVTATLQTSAGTVTLRLDGAAAPCATASFVSLARQGYFDGTPCHRILDGTAGDGAIAQCGDPSGTGTGGPGYVYDEENLEGATYGRGTLAMAKTMAPGTTGAQFFLVTQPFPLDPVYSVVGAITGGLDVLDKVIKAGTQDGSGDGAPKTPLKLVKVTTSG
jgi:peptidyl-prolyl cis-trans isomerase B (cyclophilin B)